MINAQLRRKDGILIVTPTGRLQRADFEQLRLLVDPYIEEHGGLTGVLIDAESFPGWEDFSGLLSHLRFASNYHERIERIAAVTDSSFLAILPRVADHFAAAEVRHFEYRERDAALDWLREGRQDR
ncbi:MAG: STAS/SEC14 domain-containing protein [Gammaproteobacteria bacterium]|jgi:hypothetical protein